MKISQNPDIGYIWNFIAFSDYWVSTEPKTVCWPSPTLGKLFLLATLVTYRFLPNWLIRPKSTFSKKVIRYTILKKCTANTASIKIDLRGYAPPKHQPQPRFTAAYKVWYYIGIVLIFQSSEFSHTQEFILRVIHHSTFSILCCWNSKSINISPIELGMSHSTDNVWITLSASWASF